MSTVTGGDATNWIAERGSEGCPLSESDDPILGDLATVTVARWAHDILAGRDHGVSCGHMDHAGTAILD